MRLGATAIRCTNERKARRATCTGKQGGIALKPFLPQLQTTFVKCLSDAAKAVRERAADALGLLMSLQPRVDPVVGDLCTSAASAPDITVRHTMLVALQGTLVRASTAYLSRPLP
jgi:HEAT repeat protein